MKRNVVAKKILPIIVKTLIASLYAGHAFGDTVVINTPTVISGSHPNDIYEINGGGLTLSPGTLLGSNSTRVLNAYGDALVSVDSGTKIIGSVGVGGTSQLFVGVGADRTATETGDLIMAGNAKGTFDNFSLLEHSALAALDLQDSSRATLSARSIIRNTGVPGGDAISLIDDSQVTLNGSTVEAEGHGVFIDHNGSATANNASITGNIDGAYLSGNGKLSVSGGTVISLLGGSHPFLNEGKYGAGIKIIGAAATGTLGITPGISVVDVSNGTVIIAKGSNSAGISSQTYGTSTANINVSESTVSGGKYGILVDYDGSVNSISGSGSAGLSTIKLNHSMVISGADAIHVNANGRGNFSINNSDSRITGGNGVVLGVDAGGKADFLAENSVLTGNAVNNGIANISLKNTVWNGAMQNVSNMTLDANSALNLSGASAIGNLNNGGAVSVANGKSADNVLTVGNYTGNNGYLLFNAVLSGAGSTIDKMVVNGNTSGTTNVSVNKIGGTGASVLDGIELIQVAGKSDGNFIQKGQIVAGAYEYHLLRGQNGNSNNWYLDSTDNPISPVVSPVISPVRAVHIVRAEAGSYIANQAASDMFSTTLRERAGENRYLNGFSADGEASSLWLRQVGIHNRFSDSSGQLQTSGNTYLAQLGGDIAQWSSNNHDHFHLGIMAGYGNNKNNTHSTVSGHSSKGSLDGYSAGLYSTWYQNDADNTGMYVDGQVMYSWFNNYVNADSYKSNGLTASTETGYTLGIGQSGPMENPTRYFIEPQAQVTWMGVKADNLTESNGTRVSSQGDNNVQTRLGLRAFMQGHSRVDNGKDRTFQPFVEVNWLHNTRNNGVTMNGVSLEQAGTTNVGEVKLGVEGKLSKATALWGSVGLQTGDKGYSNTDAIVGVKYSF